jgi:zinc transporter ZupT
MAGTFGATLSYLLTSNNNFNETCYLNPESSVLMMQNHSRSRSSLSVLPFTIGGFLYISLVGIVPEIVEEQDKKISILQMFSFLFGVLFIYCLVQIEHILPGLNV